MSEFDVVITPSSGGNQLAMTNLTGHPAMCVPAGFDKRTGLPTSITFLGNLWGEAQILLAANVFQRETDWEDMHPPKFK
jgi:Asp-tRNA(Asn)/Glu-tRNA(Gln) amidotransferase A subunit family amidase